MSCAGRRSGANKGRIPTRQEPPSAVALRNAPAGAAPGEGFGVRIATTSLRTGLAMTGLKTANPGGGISSLRARGIYGLENKVLFADL